MVKANKNKNLNSAHLWCHNIFSFLLFTLLLFSLRSFF